MSSSFTYPGVYIQEVPSTVHTIVPVPTAVAAFVGRAIRGPINQAWRVHSFADFERTFGGIWANSEMPFAVQQYFLNGGSDAYIVRAITQAIVTAQAVSPAAIGVPTSLGALNFLAQNPGAWFQNVTIAIDLNTRKVGGARRPDEFNVTMTYREVDPVTGAANMTVETFANVSYLAGSPNFISTTLQNDSNFIAVQSGASLPQAQPIPGVYSMSGSVWTPNTALALGVSIIDPNGNEQVVTTAGVTGRSSPAWHTNPRSTTTDGTVVWTNQSGAPILVWQPLTHFNAGDLIFDGTNLQEVTTAGSTGGAPPATWGTTAGSTTTDGGVTWTFVGPEAGGWRPGTAYDVGAQIVDTNGDVETVTVAGTSGANPPTWATVPGGVVTDGTVHWTNSGPAPTGLWEPNTYYPVGAEVFDSSGNLQQVTTAGTSGTTQPAWVTAGTTADGPTLVWTFQSATGLSDGAALVQADITAPGLELNKQGMYALKNAEIFTMLILPPHSPQENAATIDLDPTYAGLWGDALAFCDRERAILYVDPPSPALWIDEPHAYQDVTSASPAIDNVRNPNSVTYYPWILANDPLLNNRPRAFAPSATAAGVAARIDGTRGVWKSPAGEEAKMLGVSALQYLMNDAENGELNPLGINCLRTFPIIGSVIWGARTLDGADAQASQWKYLAVRRMALFIEDSLYRGTGWAVFEPNDEPLWSELRLNVGSFMRNLFRQGAFQGSTPQQAYFVKCDSDTTTQTDIDNGVVNILVGFAPLKPAEFIVIKISQITGDIQS